MARKSLPGSFVRHILAAGPRAVGPRVVLCARPGSGRIAVVASRKVGSAVQRNRSKRILRAALRDAAGQFTEDMDIVLLARVGIAGATSTDLAPELLELAARLGVRRDE